MRISRLYLPSKLATGDTIDVTGDAAHYILTVLRLRQGYSLIVFNGEGGEFDAVLTALGPKKAVKLVIGEFRSTDIESPLNITLALAISRGERMDFAVQKAVELGVSTIVPLFTEYCVIKLDEQQAQRRLRHWQLIAQHACEQCGRNKLPEIALPLKFNDWLLQTRSPNRFIFHPDQAQHLNNLEIDQQQIELLIGPEGGFSDTEYQLSVNSGYCPVSLGSRILRSETAVITALSLVQHLWGDI
ncbi:MAG: 16S rRNA (uracil(1498)-N(3))-methyltransferase [Gammaproteobacteria bacterium]|nr:16S rRNA (uracil(1498)-N(3))-methyltransferase [Gammaproteobacteria bacterium]